jgi:AcrR family transcriptional regulator
MSKGIERQRRYSSAIRQEQAASTRARILSAAGELFEAQGYARTTIRAVAEHAGVAADTVYATFGSKARLLTALIDLRLVPAGDVVNVLDTPEAQAIRAERDQRRQLHLFAQWVTATLARVRSVYEILRTASAVEPEIAAIHAEIDGYRLQNMRGIAEWLTANGALRVDGERVAEILWAVASPDLSRMLCESRHWTDDEYAQWLEEVLGCTLLRSSAETRASEGVEATKGRKP